MNQVNLSDNLERLMRLHGIRSLTELAKLTHLPQPTLHHILMGITKKPRKRALEALAEFFSVSVEQLIGVETLPSIVPEKVKINLNLQSVPIIQWNMIKNWPPKNLKQLHLTEVLLERKLNDDSFAVKVSDDSMEPLFPEHSLLIFDYGRKPKDRDFVVVYFERSNTILFNRLFIENEELFIKQDLDGGNAKLIKCDPVVDKIIGTLVEVRILY